MCAQAKNRFEKDFFQLMNNSVFGKTMENICKHVNVDLVTESQKMKKLVAKHTFKVAKQFNEHLVGVNMVREKLLLNKPVYTGFTLLDLSKVLMYQFHYQYMLPKYARTHLKLLFTDTDSLCYQVLTDGFYRDIGPDLEKFDKADYPKQHVLPMNKRVIGKFKDETSSCPIRELVGLRPKMYSFIIKKDGKEKKKKTAKGVRNCVTERDIRHVDYKDCLFTKTVQSHSMMQIIGA